MRGLIGRKMGMTQVYDGEGRSVAVTVIEAGPCPVIQRKTVARDGYDAVQLGFCDGKERNTAKPALARFKKAGVTPKRFLKEFPVDDKTRELQVGELATVSILDGVSHVDVTGINKGRGFQGVVKRHRMRGGPETHGGHSKRRIGAIGQREYPARVHKGKRMPGHMGNVKITQQNLRVVELRGDANLILVEGAVPGPNGGIVFVRKALKKTKAAAEVKAS